jgi:hypothetical protein
VGHVADGPFDRFDRNDLVEDLFIGRQTLDHTFDLADVGGDIGRNIFDGFIGQAQAELGDTARCEEDVLSYIAFPPVAEKFFAERKAQEEKLCRYSIEAVED